MDHYEGRELPLSSAIHLDDCLAKRGKELDVKELSSDPYDSTDRGEAEAKGNEIQQVSKIRAKGRFGSSAIR